MGPQNQQSGLGPTPPQDTTPEMPEQETPAVEAAEAETTFEPTDPAVAAVAAEEAENPTKFGGEPKPESSEPVVDTTSKSEPATLEQAAATVPTEAELPGDMTGVTPTVLPGVSTKKPKKGLIITLIIAGVLLLAGIAGGLVYALVYNNPERVVMNAFSKAINAESGEVNMDVTFETESTSMREVKLNFQSMNDGEGRSSGSFGAQFNYAGKDLDLKASYAGSEGKAFVKLQDVDEVIKKLYGEEKGAALIKQIGPIFNKVNNKWLVITAKDFDDLRKNDSAEATCVQKELSRLQKDKNVRSDVMRLYNEHKPVSVETKGSDGDGKHYALKLNSENVKAFITAFTDTDAFKAIDDCTDTDYKKSVLRGVEDIKDLEKLEFDIWVNGWSQEINKVEFGIKSDDGKSSAKAEIRTKFNNRPAVTIPEADTTIDELKSDIEGLQRQLVPTTRPSAVSPSYNYYY